MSGFADLGEGGRVWRRPKKVNLGRKCVQTNYEGKSSCEKLRVVLGVLLVVAVCQIIPMKMKIMQQCRKPEFRTSRIYSTPRSVGRPSLGAGGMGAALKFAAPPEPGVLKKESNSADS